jgi:hypothetical protein
VIERFSVLSIRKAAVTPLFWTLLAAFVAIFRLAFTPGIPAYQHDWMWPLTQTGVSAALADLRDGWSWMGDGHRHLYPFAIYLFVPLLWAMYLIGSKTVLVGYLFGCFALSGAGASAAARLLGVRSRAAELVAALLYAFSPVVFNKIAAGHYYYWIGYALLPWLLSLTCEPVRESRFWQRWALIALVLSVSWAQVQFLAFDFALLALVVLARVQRVGLRCITAAVAVALLTHVYAIVMLVHPPLTTSLASQHALPSGVISESAAWMEALRLDGYPPGYYFVTVVNRVPWGAILADLLVGVTVFALVGLVYASRSKRYARPLVITVLLFTLGGFVVVTGVHGPLGSMVVIAFERVRALSILKELYHAMVIPALGVALGGAIVVDCCAAYSAMLCASTVVLAFVIAAPLLVGLENDCYDFVNGRALDGQLTRLEAHMTMQRTLLMPNAQPLAPVGAFNSGGLDAASMRSVMTPALFDGYPSVDLAFLNNGFLFGTPTLRAALADHAVRYVVIRDDIVSRRSQASALNEEQSSRFSASVARTIALRAGLRPLARTAAADVFEEPRSVRLVDLAPFVDALAADQRDAAAFDGSHAIFVYPHDLARVPRKMIRRRDPALNDTLFALALRPREPVELLTGGGFLWHTEWAWTPYTFYVNDWLVDSPTPTLFTLASERPLWFSLARTRDRELVFVASSLRPITRIRLMTDVAPAYDVVPSSLNAWRSGTPTTYALVLPKRAMRVGLGFAHLAGGIALGEIATYARADVEAARVYHAPRVFHRVIPPLIARIERRGDDVFTLTLSARNPASCAVVLRTTFDPGWRVLGVTGAVTHFVASGWANGFVVPCHGKVEISFDDRFYRYAIAQGAVLIVLLVVISLVPRLGEDRSRFARRDPT